MLVHPLADGGEDVNRRLRNRAVRLWSYIQQVVAGVTRTGHQIAHNRFRRFPIVICALVAPTVVHGHARFPRLRIRLNVLFGSSEVFDNAGAVIDQNVRLKLAHHFVHLFGLPTFGRQRPVDVIPENVQLAVVRTQLAHLTMDVIHKPASRRFIGLAHRPVRMVPIHQRIIEAHVHSFTAGGFHELRYQVTAGRLLWRTVVGQLGIEVAEAFVMLGGHHHILHAGRLRQLRPSLGGVRFGVKLLS